MTDPLSQQFKEFALASSGPDGDADRALVAADYFLEHNEIRLAASAFDRAFGLRPHDESIRRQRGNLLDQLAIHEHGLCFRYIPAGTFLMGSGSGEVDEQPVHPVPLDDYWVSDIPVTWSTYAELMAFSPPPRCVPASDVDRSLLFALHQKNKIRLQYCETETIQAGDWHAHDPDQKWQSGDRLVSSEEIFGRVSRDNPARPFAYNVKPMVAVSWQEAEELCEQISTSSVLYHLPTEAQWEKAARGGLIGQRYSWGDETPDAARCDFGHFGDWVIRNPLSIRPNDYGLHGMCGGVWEWTEDRYDALSYRTAAERLSAVPAPTSASSGESPPERVLRGGSWADCAEVVTVSFRMSRSSQSWRQQGWCAAATPTIGFRLCRTEIH